MVLCCSVTWRFLALLFLFLNKDGTIRCRRDRRRIWEYVVSTTAEPHSTEGYCQTHRNKTMWMEQISVAFLRAVASEACVTMAHVSPDVDGVDVELSGQRVRIPFAVQLKSTHTLDPSADSVSFRFELLDYNRLVINAGMRTYLAMLLLPNPDTRWVRQSDGCLEIPHQMRWALMTGRPAVTDQTKVEVKLPIDQLVTPEWLRSVVDELLVERGVS